MNHKHTYVSATTKLSASFTMVSPDPDLCYHVMSRYSVKTYMEEDEFYLVPEQLTTYGDLFPAKDNGPDADGGNGGVLTNENALVVFLQKVCCCEE